MKKIIAMLAVVAMLLPSCGSVPITGRKQLNLVSDAEVLQASLQQYASFMQTATLSTQKAKSAQVTRVGQRIAAATEAYLKYAGLESELQNFAWEFNLVKSDDINAWCMPGGKIVVYEGIQYYRFRIIHKNEFDSKVLFRYVLEERCIIKNAKR